MTSLEKTQVLNQQIEKAVTSLATRVNRAAHQYPERSFVSNGDLNNDPVSTTQNDTFRRPANTTIPGSSDGQYYAQVVAERFDAVGNPDPKRILAIEANSTVLVARPEKPAERQLTYT